MCQGPIRSVTIGTLGPKQSSFNENYYFTLAVWFGRVFHIIVRTLCKSLSWNVHNIQVYTNGLNTNLFFDYSFNSMRMEKAEETIFTFAKPAFT